MHLPNLFPMIYHVYSSFKKMLYGCFFNSSGNVQYFGLRFLFAALIVLLPTTLINLPPLMGSKYDA